MTSKHVDAETEETRRAAVAFYRKLKDAGRDDSAAFYGTMHEVRTLSEDDLRAWLGEEGLTVTPERIDASRARAAFGSPRPEDVGPPSPEELARLRKVFARPEAAQDDEETALAPETGRWRFDERVAEAFDDMLARSIPNYGDMRRIVTDAACWHVDASGLKAPMVVDLGASRGAGLQPILDRMGVRARYLAVEESEPMLEALTNRFEDWEGTVGVLKHDLREGMPPVSSPLAVVLSVLTLQFVPIEHRQRLLREAHERLHPRGALIVVEKVLGATFELDALETDLYYGLKRENGYSEAAIERKRLSLEGALVPVTAEMNESFFRGAGFTAVDCVWAWCNFRAWVAVKR